MTNIFKHVLCVAFFAISPLIQAQWYFELASNDTHFSDYSISSTATTPPTPTNLESFEGIRDFSYGLGYIFPFKKVEERLVDNKPAFLRINTGLSFDNMNLRTSANINNVGYPTNYNFAQIQGRLGVMLSQTLFSKNDVVDGGRSPALDLALNGGMGYNHFTAASRQSPNTTANLLNKDKEFKSGYLSYYYGAGLHFHLSKHTQLFAEYRMEQGTEISEKSGTNNQTTESYRLDKNKLVFGLVFDLKLANRIKKQRKARLSEMEAKVDSLTAIVNTPAPTYDDSAIVARIDSIEQQLTQKPVPNQLNESSLKTDVNEQGVRYFKNFEHVTFPNNSSYFNRNSYANLFFKLTSFLQQNPNVRLQLVGYADKTGSVAYNLEISRKRANRVRDHLINTHGIAPSRIEAIGAGETQQFSISNSMENRRTEIIILQD